LLVSVVNQFGLMQQQMLDQFQQTISMLVQTFGKLHREQMDTIREELDQIRNLTREFQALKRELAERTSHQPAARTPETRAADGENASTDLAVSGGRKKQRVLGGPSASTSFPELAPPSPDAAPPIAANAPSLPPLPAPSVPEPAGPKSSENGPSGRRQAAGEFKPDSDRDMVVWLHQRMVHLQHERETRWQKILKLLPGLS
jgi:hypothetical protein